MSKLSDNLRTTLWAIVIDFGKDLGKAVLPEAWPAVQEYLKQRLTPDGWTKVEYGTYLLGVISRVRRAQIGNAVTDKGVDWLLDALEDLVNDAIDGAEQNEPPAEEPPPVEEPGPDYSGVPLEILLDEIPSPAGYPDGVKLWRYTGTGKYILTKPEATAVGASGALVATSSGGSWLSVTPVG